MDSNIQRQTTGGGTVPARGALPSQRSAGAQAADAGILQAATIGVGGAPSYASAAMLPPFVYVTSTGTDAVDIIDTTTNTLVLPSPGIPLPLGAAPLGIAATPIGKVYVAASGMGAVLVIDSNTQTVIATIPLGLGITRPDGVAFAPNGRVFVSDATAGTVSVIDAVTDTVLFPSIPVGTAPKGVAVSPNGKAYVADSGADKVAVLNAGSPTTPTYINLPIGSTPVGVAVAPNGRLYVANQGLANVSVIDTISDTVLGTITLPGTVPTEVAAAPDGRVYVSDRAGGTVSLIDSYTDQPLGGPLPAGPSPLGLTVAPNGQIYVVNNTASGTVTVLDAPPWPRFFGPTSGSAAGGTTVTVTGSGFTGATAISFAGVPGTIVSVVDDSTLVATTAPGTAGTAGPVVVTGPGGTGTSVASFTYATEATTTTLVSSPAFCQESFTLTATVTDTAANPVTTGNVTFILSDDGPSQTIAVGAGGTAVATFPGLPAGTHDAIAQYQPTNPNLAGSTSAITAVTVAEAPTSTTVVAVPGTINPLQNTVLTATVAPANAGNPGVPTGTVTFTDGGAYSDTQPLVGGVATSTTTSPPLAGGATSAITATYNGEDPCFAGSSGTTSVTVNPPAATTLTAAPATVRLRTNGTFVIPTLSATLTETVGGAPVVGATITFSAGATILGTATTDAGGVAALTNTTVPSGVATSTSYTATFAGTPAHGPSTGTGSLTFQPFPLVP